MIFPRELHILSYSLKAESFILSSQIIGLLTRIFINEARILRCGSQKLIFSTLLTLCILGLVAGGMLYFHLKSELPSVEALKTVELQQPMQIYTADGKLIGEVGEQRRIPVKLAEVPQRLIDAFLATEDSRFYDHHGLDPIGIARALFVAVNNGGASQGASTITQQLARNFFLTPEKTIIRKAREAVLAVEIENTLTKQEILELYLNKIFFRLSFLWCCGCCTNLFR